MHAHEYVYVCTHVQTYIYISTYTHIHIHTQIHTPFGDLKMALYWVATISRLLKITGLFCRISSLLQGSFAKETYNFKEPTNCSHHIVPNNPTIIALQVLIMDICIHICIYMNMYMYICTHAHTYIYMSTYKHIHAQTHTHLAVT